MKLFVFEDVLTDYTSGMVLVAAEDLTSALEYTKEQFESSFDREAGWKEPTAVYDIDDKVEPGIREYCWGGG